VGDALTVRLRGRIRPTGARGIRHHLLVVPSVLCAAQAASAIAEGIPGAVAIEHQHGCAELTSDAGLTEQILVGLGTHPNVAGTLVVSLGCESVQGLLLYRAIERRRQRAEFVGIQQAGGTLAAIRAGREALARLRDAADEDPEGPVGWGDLRIGVEAAWLSLPAPHAAVFVGVIRRLLARGATVIQAVPGFVERGPSATVPEIATPPEALASLPARTIGYAGQIPGDRAESGGAGAGLLLMAAPATRIAQKTGLAAAGAHVILSALAEGLPAGCPVAPVVHVGIAPYARLFARDVEVMVDERPDAEAPEAVIAALATVCREETAAEALGMFEMAIHRIAPTM